MNKTIIRPLVYNDFPQWLPLWDGNNLGQRNEAVTSQTWERLSDPENTQVNGLCIVRGDEMMGIVHYILHPTTGQINPVCYMQDVYIAPAHRRKGLAKKLVEDVVRIGEKEKWGRMYWLTPNDNIEARALYRSLGIKLDFSFYVLPIGGA
ncbi:MAG: GNAT family N-acetyltransferase [Alphaproteobacteria bacterium]|nr:GNAT family N-acetyltransferase [Alphaproteobacteria bacterium]